MNELIAKLYEQAIVLEGNGDYVAGELDPVKFAELIVRECLEQGSILTKHYIDTHPEQEQAWLLASIADYSNEIKKHFGVEE